MLYFSIIESDTYIFFYIWSETDKTKEKSIIIGVVISFRFCGKIIKFCHKMKMQRKPLLMVRRRYNFNFATILPPVSIYYNIFKIYLFF